MNLGLDKKFTGNSTPPRGRISLILTASHNPHSGEVSAYLGDQLLVGRLAVDIDGRVRKGAKHIVQQRHWLPGGQGSGRSKGACTSAILKWY